MAHFVLEYRYGDADTRARVRPLHLEYIADLHTQGKVLLGGPIGDGSGAMVVYSVEDEAEARRLVENDPYAAEGVATEPRLREWTVVIPAQS